MATPAHCKQLLAMVTYQTRSNSTCLSSRTTYRLPTRPWLLFQRKFSIAASRAVQQTCESHTESAIPLPEIKFPQEHDAYVPFDHNNTLQSSSEQLHTHDLLSQGLSFSFPSHASNDSSKQHISCDSIEEEPEIEIENKLAIYSEDEDSDLPSRHSTSLGFSENENTIFRLQRTEEEDAERAKKPRTTLRKERRAAARMSGASPTGNDNTAVGPSVVGISTRKPKNTSKIAPKTTQASINRRVRSSKTENWQIQKAALEVKFGEKGWAPRKRLSPDALEGIRALHAQYPDKFTTPVLAEQFEVSPEAIRRILKSKWQPNAEEAEDRRLRWDKRGETIWKSLVTKGVHPPKKWREMGIGAGSKALRPSEASSMSFQHRDSRKSSQQDGVKWAGSLAARIL